NWASIEQGLCELREIVGCRKDARVSSDSPHSARGRVVHDSVKHPPAFVVFSRSNLRQPLSRRTKTGVGHSQRSKDILRAIRIKWNSAHSLDQRTKYDEIDIAIDESGFGWRNRRNCKSHVVSDIAARPGMAQVKVRRKPGA